MHFILTRAFRVRILTLALSLVAALATSTSAQSVNVDNADKSYNGDPKDLVVVGLVDDLRSLGVATILRLKHGQQRNVILLRRSTASSGVLERALQQLSASRQKHGTVPDAAVHVRMEGLNPASKHAPTVEHFNRLLRAPRFEVVGAGNVPAISIVLADEPKDKVK